MESVDLSEVDEQYKDTAFDRRELLAKLKELHAAYPEDVGVIWRLTRAAYDVFELKATSATEKKEFIYYAYGIIQKAVNPTTDDASVHNWYGIILSSIGDYEGTKVAISNAYVIKEHWEKAIELNPTNPFTYYLLGRWCVAIADLTWLERKAASMLFGTPPESSYDEALKFLLKSEELAVESWKPRPVQIAHVYKKKKDKKTAKEWVAKALAIPVVTDEDEIAHDDALALQKKLG